MLYRKYSDEAIAIIKTCIVQGRLEEAIYAAQDFGKCSPADAKQFVIAYAEEIQNENASKNNGGHSRPRSQ